MSRVHYRTTAGYRCGVGRRWPSQFLTSTRSLTAVTCRSCLRLEAMKENPGA